MRRNVLPLLWFLLAAGCTTPPAPSGGPLGAPASLPAISLPADALVTQRAVLTALGRQYPLNGYLALSAAGGRRLIVTGTVGAVLADVLVKPNGMVFVMRSSKQFRPKWIQRYIAGDLMCIFGGAPDAACPMQRLSENHFMIKRRWYKLDLHIVETKPGLQPAEMFDETHK
jgi:hypothetical protein